MAGLVERQQEEGLEQGRLGAPRSGRAGVFSLGLVVGFLLLGYVVLRALELTPRGSSGRALVRQVEERPGPAWQGTLELGGVRVSAWLLPLHDEPTLERFRARTLRERYGLPAGAPWRLVYRLEGASDTPGELAPPRVTRAGSELARLAEVAPAPAASDPLHALLTAVPRALRCGESGALVLWGELEAEDSPAVELAFGDEPATLVLAPAEVLDLPRSYARLAPPARASAPTGEEALRAEIARLESELERERERRAERELAFQAFRSELDALAEVRDRLLGKPEVAAAIDALTPEEQEARAAAEAARTRAAELGRALSVRMKLEGLRGLDLLESGSLLPGPPAAIGPVVFRVLDERGRLTGSLSAERLRLEASVAARTLTVVLEDGFESRAGERVPFLEGTRRITLTDVDPEGWFEDFPELFDGPDAGRTDDDGRWRLADVRRELNRLLALEQRAGWYRLHSLGGVRDTRLNEVLLEELEPSGRVRRRFLADTLELFLEDASLVLVLKDGAIVRGEEKQPFQDGLYRLVLPGIAPEAWRAASLPGLAEPPGAGKEQEATGNGR